MGNTAGDYFYVDIKNVDFMAEVDTLRATIRVALQSRHRESPLGADEFRVQLSNPKPAKGASPSRFRNGGIGKVIFRSELWCRRFIDLCQSNGLVVGRDRKSGKDRVIKAFPAKDRGTFFESVFGDPSITFRCQTAYGVYYVGESQVVLEPLVPDQSLPCGTATTEFFVNFSSLEVGLRIHSIYGLVACNSHWKFRQVSDFEMVTLSSKAGTHLLFRSKTPPRCVKTAIPTLEGTAIAQKLCTPNLPANSAGECVYGTAQAIVVCFDDSPASNKPPYQSLAHVLGFLKEYYRGDPPKGGTTHLRVVAPSVFARVVDLPFSVAMALEALMSTPVMNRYQLTQKVQDFVRSLPEETAKAMLYRLANPEGRPAPDIVACMQKEIEAAKKRRTRRALVLPPGKVLIHRLILTPTRFIVTPPAPEDANRMVRHTVANNSAILIRVTFANEDRSELTGMSHQSFDNIGRYFESQLLGGISLAGRRFEYLAYSLSQMRERSCWMCAPAAINGTNAEQLRQWMGQVNLRTTARYGARLSQTLTTTTEALQHVKIKDIADVERNGYCFTDGCGKIPPALLEQVWKAIGYSHKWKPVALQIRTAGYKGMVVRHEGMEVPDRLELPASMKKFHSTHGHLEICGYSANRPAFLNRQIIKIMEALDVNTKHIFNLQEDFISLVKAASEDTKFTARLLANYQSNTFVSFLKQCFETSPVVFDDLDCPFISAVINLLQLKSLHGLVSGARIPLEKARNLKGVADWTGTLQQGQIFVQLSPPSGGKLISLAGKRVAVVKCPALAVGDLRVLSAVDAPELSDLYDVIVFPINGDRPHPNESSGSDLDGDDYFVCWDEQLVPKAAEAPHNYSAKPKDQDDEYDGVTPQKMIKFLITYIRSDSLGMIANRHLAWSDRHGMKDPQSIELADLHSIAVDFQKTGKAAVLDEEKFPMPDFPDFMENGRKPAYKTSTLLGVLYRRVAEEFFALNKASEPTPSPSQQRRKFDFKRKKMNVRSKIRTWIANYDGVAPAEKIATLAAGLESHGIQFPGLNQLLDTYNDELSGIMESYAIRNEVEVVSGQLTSNFKLYRNRDGSPREDQSSLITELFEMTRDAAIAGWWAEFLGPNGLNDTNATDLARRSAVAHRISFKACATYCLCYEQAGAHNDDKAQASSVGPLLSFPWVVCGGPLVEFLRVHLDPAKKLPLDETKMIKLLKQAEHLISHRLAQHQQNPASAATAQPH